MSTSEVGADTAPTASSPRSPTRARVDRFLETLNKPAPANDGAENAVALWATVAGIVLVLLTFSIPADRDRYLARRAREAEERRNNGVAACRRTSAAG